MGKTRKLQNNACMNHYRIEKTSRTENNWLHEKHKRTDNGRACSKNIFVLITVVIHEKCTRTDSSRIVLKTYSY